MKVEYRGVVIPERAEYSPDVREALAERYKNEVAACRENNLGEYYWEDSPEEGAVWGLYCVLKYMEANYAREDEMQKLGKGQEPEERERKRIFREFLVTDPIAKNLSLTYFEKDIANLIYAPFPGAGPEDKLAVVQAGLLGHEIFMEQQRQELAAVQKIG